MRIFRGVEDAAILTPTVLTFGIFDGLHLGHQAIMRSVVESGRSTGLLPTVVTFDPHPRAVLHPQSAPPLLQTFEQKMEWLERLGIQQVVVINFTLEFSKLSAEEFLLDIIFGRMDAREVYLGQGFAFGHNRQGRFELLKRVADRLGRAAFEVPEVLIRGKRISSTAIRRCLKDGHINLARRMLGRPYSIEGYIVEGRRIGKSQLGHATANLRTQNCATPANGVYITLALLGHERFRSVTNIGHRPTFGGDHQLHIETHFLEFEGELYGEKLRICFLHRLRAEKKFESPEALRAQIERDCRRAVRYFRFEPVRRNLLAATAPLA
jgi:riboflavin kinase/FMN adenylyltransferase